jgi:hypothetical protein
MRGYGHDHQLRRKRLAPLVAAGLAVCVRCGQSIKAGSEWALDHRDDRQGYLGPAHARCNARAGAAKVNGTRTQEKLLRWSRVWFEPIPPHVELMDGWRH